MKGSSAFFEVRRNSGIKIEEYLSPLDITIFTTMIDYVAASSPCFRKRLCEKVG